MMARSIHREENIVKCLALYHVRFEDLGHFAPVLEGQGYEIVYRHAGTQPLSREEWCDADLVIILGGPIGVNDTARYPWLQDEIAGLRLRLDLERPTFGVCLGAQLIAVALGGSVVRRTGQGGGGDMEIGWAPVSVAPGDPALAALHDVPVLHWHGDNIVPPAHVAALATTPGTPCQAFAVGRHVLAVQFHPEFMATALEEWTTGHAVELTGAGVDLARLRADTLHHGAAAGRAGQDMFAAWLARLGEEGTP